MLVARIIGEKLGRKLAPSEIVGEPLPRIHKDGGRGSGYPRKVQQAIATAQSRQCTSVVIVVDRDRTPGNQRRALLCEGIELAREDGNPLCEKTVIGVAIETVEAWLLADEVALNGVLDLQPPWKAPRSPEGLSGGPNETTHPKRVFEKAVANGLKRPEFPYSAVAEAGALETIAKRCPDGFAPLKSGIESRCLQ